MDLKELRQMSSAELSEKAKQLSQELFNPMQIRKTKRTIAQVKTVQREVEQAEQKKAS